MTLDEICMYEAEWSAMFPSTMPMLPESGISELMDDWGWKSNMSFDVDSWFILFLREAIK